MSSHSAKFLGFVSEVQSGLQDMDLEIVTSDIRDNEPGLVQLQSMQASDDSIQIVEECLRVT